MRFQVATYRLLALSIAMPPEGHSPTLLAGTFCRIGSAVELLPLPAKVVMTPALLILRTRHWPLSLTYTLPAVSTSSAVGSVNDADVAGPPSPFEGPMPPPAYVVMMGSAAEARLHATSTAAPTIAAR